MATKKSGVKVVPHAVSVALAAMGVALPAVGATHDYHWNYQQWAGENAAWFSDEGLWSEGVAPKGDEAANLYLRSVAEPDWGNHDGGFYQPQAFVLPSDSDYNKTFNSIRSSMPAQYIKVVETGLVVRVADPVVRVADPTGFEGLWRFECNKNPGFEFANDGEFCPVVQYLLNGYRVNINTATESTRAAVGWLTSPGVFVKKGPGELRIVNAAPLGTTCLLKEGTLTLGRAPAEPIASLPEGFIYHLDAMAEGTLTTEDGDDGYRHVVKWEQVESKAQPMQRDEQWAAPRLVIAHGRPLVDFGAHANGVGAYFKAGEETERGPAAMLWTAPHIAPVREVFFVAEVTTESKQMVVPFGGRGYYAWQLNGDIAGNPEYAGGQGDVASGFWMQDGVAKRRGNFGTKHRLVVYSVKGWFAATESVTRAFDCLAFSGVGSEVGRGSVGGLRLGEVVAYSRELTDDERLAAQHYLMAKWHDGSERFAWDLDTVGLTANGTPVNVEAGAVARVRHVFGSHGAGSDYPHYTLTKTGEGELVVEDVHPRGTLPIRVEAGSLGFAATIARDAIDDSAPAAGAYLHLDATLADTLVLENGQVAMWKDCDGRPTYASRQSGMALPTVADTGVGDGKAVDFGDFQVNGACLILGDETIVHDDPEDKTVYPWDAHVTEAFVVWKRNDGADDNSHAPLFSANGWYFVNFKGQVFSEDNAAPEIQGANLTVNGVHMWGHTGFDSISPASGFNVYNISYGSQTMPINALALWVNGKAGGCQIAEYICYQRPLSDQERRNTVAYLMKKWGKGAHPEATPGAVGPVTFAEGNATPTIGTDAPRTVASVTVEGEARTLVKTGAGRLAIGSLSGVSALDVREGAIEVESTETAVGLAALAVPAAQFGPGARPLVLIGGALTLAETGTLSIELPETAEYGTEYPLVSAGTLSGTVTGWTTTLSGPAKLRRDLRLFVRGNTLYAKLLKRGLVVFIH